MMPDVVRLNAMETCLQELRSRIARLELELEQARCERDQFIRQLQMIEERQRQHS